MVRIVISDTYVYLHEMLKSFCSINDIREENLLSHFVFISESSFGKAKGKPCVLLPNSTTDNPLILTQKTSLDSWISDKVNRNISHENPNISCSKSFFFGLGQ